VRSLPSVAAAWCAGSGMSFLPSVRLYRNVNHESYKPDETQFDADLAVEDHSVTSPTPAEATELQQDVARFKKEMKKESASNSAVNSDAERDGDDPEEEAKRIERAERRRKALAGSSDDASHEHGNNELAAVDSATEGVFSQLLLESILEQKSVTDFVGGLPDKRGTLLVRFPTTLLGKSWKRRYFTLHGESLYFSEDQALIHPSLGAAGMSSSVSGPGKAGAQGVNYDKCKRIDIANFWIISADGAAEAVANVAAAMAERDKKEGATGNKDKDKEQEKDNKSKDKKSKSGLDDEDDEASAAGGAEGKDKEKKKTSKFDEVFAAQKAKI